MTKSVIIRSYASESEVIIEKIRQYCAYQERCTQEVERKMQLWKVAEARRQKILVYLKEEGYIDEERYARMFVRGKFHINKWGRVKIRHELRSRAISETLISKAMEEIGEDDYLKTIRELTIRKMSEIKSEKHLNIREKIINFVAGKGFEFDLINKVLTELKI
jgi:regulatory protein